jgi:hypothetical protein
MRMMMVSGTADRKQLSRFVAVGREVIAVVQKVPGIEHIYMGVDRGSGDFVGTVFFSREFNVRSLKGLLPDALAGKVRALEAHWNPIREFPADQEPRPPLYDVVLHTFDGKLAAGKRAATRKRKRAG